MVLRDGESVGVELTASDPAGHFTVVLFAASVPYEAIHRVYESRASLTVRKRLSQTNLFSLFSGNYGESGGRVEYVRLTGPQGHAELAISKVRQHIRTSADNNGIGVLMVFFVGRERRVSLTFSHTQQQHFKHTYSTVNRTTVIVHSTVVQRQRQRERSCLLCTSIVITLRSRDGLLRITTPY